ncbi:uncharacterized protein [Lolium perenne]|uniref:uncharacterized protein n=1 Tax=Lolium perenne TaxID=4522 RepID=UPI0021F52EC6|nr:uncharacterized protein LOC127341953 [Lolium perenne]
MVKGMPKSRPIQAAAEVVFDPSVSGTRKPRRADAPSSTSEYHHFMGSSLSNMYHKPPPEKSADMSDDEPDDIDIEKLLKDVELFDASTWKDRKQIQNRKVVELGGKAIKKQRTPLSVAKPAMKNQQKREQKKIEEERLLGIFRKRDKGNKFEKTRPEDRVLKATEGRFKNGILDVKHLMGAPKPSSSFRDEPEREMRGKGKKGGKGKGKGKGKQKGGRRNRR